MNIIKYSCIHVLRYSINVHALFSDSFSFVNVITNQFTGHSNKSNYYYQDITKVLMQTSNYYSWLIKAIWSGLTITGITWKIIYEDSDIPEMYAPYPFSSSKKR